MGVVANGGGDDGSKSKSYKVAMAAEGVIIYLQKN